jgi:hypothetical protein
VKNTIALFVCAIALVGFTATTAVASDMTKLGRGTLLLDKNEIEIKKDTEVSSLMFRAKNEQIRLTEITVVFADGTEKTVESKQTLRPGIDSETIDLGTSGAITSITLTHDTNGWRGSTRAPVTVYGS